MNPDFIRQRKSLLIFSMALIILLLLDAKITKISLLGNEVDLGEPRSVYWILWVCWTYFLYRFYVYSKRETSVEKSNIRQRVNSALMEPAKRLILRNLKVQGEHSEVFASEIIELRGNRLNSVQSSGLRYYYTWGGDLHWVSDNGDWTHKMIEKCVLLPIALSVRVRIRATISEIFFTPRFSEFYLPVIVAGIPVVILLLRMR